MSLRGLLSCGWIALLACGPRVAPTVGVATVMTLEDAQSIVADAERELAEASPPEPLDDPTDAEALLRVLQSDRIDLFDNAIPAAERIGGLEGRVFAAQLELSWAEAQTLVARVLERAADAVDEELRSTSTERAVGARRERLEARHRRAREIVERSRRLAAALRRVSEVHLGRGADRANAVLESDPEHYLAARLAADFHRIRQRWDAFESSVAELEARRPDSTGLKFLRGAAIVQQSGDEDDAEALLRAALSEDPRFTRAQVFLLVAQDTLPEIRDELRALERMSPHHQLVVWTKTLIEQGYLSFSDD